LETSSKVDYESIKRHAVNAAPLECCGLILADGSILQCENAAQDRRTQFLIPMHVTRRAMKEHTIAGVYHSHVGSGANLSTKDREDAWMFGNLYVIAAVGHDGSVTEIKSWLLKGDAGKKVFVALQ
jgi:proteasome lid subunit RPN8/RPN11